MLFIFNVLLLMACTNRSVQKRRENVQPKVTIVNRNDPDFDTFIKKFIDNTSFQDQRCIYPLLSLTLHDPLTNIYDTIVINSGVHDFIEITPAILKSGNYEYYTEKKDPKHAELIFQGKDTGVHIVYSFKKEKEIWILTRIIDSST